MDRCKLIAAAAIGWLAGAFGEQLVNPGFEEPTADGAIPGWTWSCDDSVARVSVVAGAGVGGSKALLVEKRSSEKEFVARQRMRLTPRGHYRVTCRIRTADFHCADLNLNGTALRVQHVIGGGLLPALGGRPGGGERGEGERGDDPFAARPRRRGRVFAGPQGAHMGGGRTDRRARRQRRLPARVRNGALRGLRPA